MTKHIKLSFLILLVPSLLNIITHTVCSSNSLFFGESKLLLGWGGASCSAQNLGVNAAGATPNASSIIDLNTGNTFTSPNGKGILPPNVALTSITDAITVTSPATSLWVYNTATAGTGTAAIVPGYYYWDGAKWVRLQTAASTAPDWSLLGNAGTTAGTNFLGTTDAQDVVFKRNATQAGLLNSSNTSFGVAALNPASSGINNSAVGASALMSNTTGSDNSAIGISSLFSNTTGSFNVANGTQSMRFNTTGVGNSAIGDNSLYSNTTGGNNSANGSESLYNNTIGSNNTASGDRSLYFNTTGSQNVATGQYGLYLNTTGSNNVAVGNSAGAGFALGDNNTSIGTNAGPSITNLINTTAIGYNAKVGQSNALVLGGTGADAVNVGIGITTPTVKLDLAGTMLNRGELHFSSNPTTVARWRILATATDLSLSMLTTGGVGGGNNFVFNSSGAPQVDRLFGQNAGTNWFVIDNNLQRVGIGTTAPSQKLHISAGAIEVVTGNRTGNLWNGSSSIDGVEIGQNAYIGVQRSNGACSHLAKPAGYITGDFQAFYVGGTGIGSITTPGGVSVSYNTTSDKRLKENLKEISFGLESVKKLKLYDYNYISDKSKTIYSGFLAQELYDIFPQAVTKGGDDVKTEPWMVDYSKLVPVLTKAIQELLLKVETLEHKVQQLEKK